MFKSMAKSITIDAAIVGSATPSYAFTYIFVEEV